MVQCCFTFTETVRLIRTESPGRPPRLSHSSWTPESSFRRSQHSTGVGRKGPTKQLWHLPNSQPITGADALRAVLPLSEHRASCKRLPRQTSAPGTAVSNFGSNITLIIQREPYPFNRGGKLLQLMHWPQAQSLYLCAYWHIKASADWLIGRAIVIVAVSGSYRLVLCLSLHSDINQ